MSIAVGPRCESWASQRPQDYPKHQALELAAPDLNHALAPPVFAPPGGIPIQTGSPAAIESLPTSNPPPSSIDFYHEGALKNDGMRTQSGSYASPPVSAGLSGPYYEGFPLYAVPAGHPGKRKVIRAAQVCLRIAVSLDWHDRLHQQACDACRQRKAKCDEGRPSLGLSGVRNNVNLGFRKDRTLLQILDKLNKLDSVQADLQLIRRYMQFTAMGGNVGMIDRPGPSEVVVSSADIRRASLPTGVDSRRTSRETLAIPAREPAQSEVVIPSEEEERERPGELSIPIGHTTAAHNLLKWPSICKLVGPVNEDYVMQGEQKHGLLRIWGRGEAVDAPTGPPVSLDKDPTPNDEDCMRGALKSPGLVEPWETGSSCLGVVPESTGDFNPDGSLKLDIGTRLRLLESYLNNIHVMHPFLDQERITKMIKKSVSKFSLLPVLSPARALWHQVRRTRMRSDKNAFQFRAEEQKICEHKDFLPGPVPDTPLEKGVSSRADSSPLSRTKSPPKVTKHSPASSHRSNFTFGVPLQEKSRMPYRSSIDTASPDTASRGHLSCSLTNVDVIPGLAYYAYAAEILGTLHGGNELAHIQAGILAGLYMGQLGRDLESWKWINSACIACQVLLRRSLNRTYYTAQIGLRKLLNRVHYALYRPEDHSNSRWSIGELKELETQLAEWRTMLPSDLQWKDSEPPPADINAARLRAKYYGACYIIHRPFLHNVIHQMDLQKQPLEASVVDACGKCITSAVQSTAAFHGISQRPIVTNIFGTAHYHLIKLIDFATDLIDLRTDRSNALTTQKAHAETWKALDGRSNVILKHTIKEAVEFIRQNYKGARILVTGSHYLVGGTLDLLAE
ncbi:MAG: hypothetical protein M1816_003340 [Peltula sp. TS41687]|nr:MAG: hypothetical protein M1816_003340 [Peltula sp. TS41687]